MVKTIQLTLYLQEDLKHKSRLVYEWVIDLSTKLKMPGCTCFRSFMSFGVHQHIHSEGFFELQGKSIIQMVFVLSQEQQRQLLKKLTEEKISCFYTSLHVESGVM